MLCVDYIVIRRIARTIMFLGTEWFGQYANTIDITLPVFETRAIDTQVISDRRLEGMAGHSGALTFPKAASLTERKELTLATLGVSRSVKCYFMKFPRGFIFEQIEDHMVFEPYATITQIHIS